MLLVKPSNYQQTFAPLCFMNIIMSKCDRANKPALGFAEIEWASAISQSEPFTMFTQLHFEWEEMTTRKYARRKISNIY